MTTKSNVTKAARKPSKAKVTKPAPATTTTARERIDADAVITKLAKENPRREGSTGHKNWSLYKNGMTVQAYLDSSKLAHLGHLRWDRDHKFIKVG